VSHGLTGFQHVNGHRGVRRIHVPDGNNDAQRPYENERLAKTAERLAGPPSTPVAIAPSVPAGTFSAIAGDEGAVPAGSGGPPG
jgi:hypothetical protein